MIIDAIRYTLQNPDGVFWKENDYHKQKELELKNPILSYSKRKSRKIKWDKRHLEVSQKKVYYDSIDFLYEEGIGQRPVPFSIEKGGLRCITNLSDHPWNPRSGRSSVIG